MTMSILDAAANGRKLEARSLVRATALHSLTSHLAFANNNAALVRDDAISAASASEAESEDDIYGGQRGRTFAKRHRQKLQAAASGQDTPNLSAVRFSTRSAAKTTTYNEDDELGLSEEDTETMTPNYWTYVDDNTPAIDSVLNHRLKDGCW